MLRKVVTCVAVLAVSAATCWALIGVATFGPNGGAQASDLPFDYWLFIGFVVVAAGFAAWFVLRRR